MNMAVPLRFSQRLARYPGVPQRWKRPRVPVAAFWFRSTPNFGDQLAAPLLQSGLGRDVVWVDPRTPGKVLSIGSVIKHIQPSDLVVGSGLLEPKRREVPPRVTILALRGPLTASMLGVDAQRDGFNFGDPGLLAAEVLGIQPRFGPESPIGIVPHYAEQVEVNQALSDLRAPADQLVSIDVRAAPEVVVNQISAVRCCISSSLHGLVVAESLGIPAIWLRGGPGLTGGRFKFDDYFLGTGRDRSEAWSLSDAIEAALASEVAAAALDLSGIRAAMVRFGNLMRPKFAL